jgi:PadR family transcriptional regulator PadR
MLWLSEYSRHMSRPELREPSFWILTALAAGRSHGYALIGETSVLSSGRVELKVPTLYAALDRLRDEGLVALDGDEVVDGRLRRYFRLTDDGDARLREEITRLEANIRQAKSRLKSRANPAVEGVVA